jgi:ribonuclease-3
VRSRLRAERGPEGRGRRGALERLRVRRHERHARLPALASLTPELRALAARLGVTPDSDLLDLLGQALTHASYAHEHPPAAHNETLAFLGDAVLGLVVADLLVRDDPDAGPGSLTIRRAELVSTRTLAAWARELGVDACLRLGRGEAQGGGRDKDSVLASAVEAVLAALYLRGGLAPVVSFLRPLMRQEIGPAES